MNGELTGTAPPEFGTDFLRWLRRESEAGWANLEDQTPGATVAWPRWRRGTRWSGGLSDEIIVQVEIEHSLKFSEPHRLFLQYLHSTVPRRYSFTVSPGQGPPRVVERPGFWDWRSDGPAISRATASAMAGIVRGVCDEDFWVPWWGPKPTRMAERSARIRQLLDAAPTLVPIFGHRFVVNCDPYPVLSIKGADIVVYGNDLREYLLSELKDFLPFRHEPSDMSTHEIPVWADLLNVYN